MRQKLKGMIGTVLALAMLLNTLNVSAAGLSGRADTVSEDQDVKIELIQNDKVVESGTNELKHTRNYTRSSSKTNGDEIVITPPEGVHYLMVQLDKYCGVPKTTGTAPEGQVEGTRPQSSSYEYEEALVYVMNDEFRFVIPGTTGTDANGNTLGGGNWPYDSRAFSTSGNTEKVITARVATEEEINARRNLALNPYDLRGNDNVTSSPNKKGDINVFPHAYANRVTDNKREFEPRNAIDGFEYNYLHYGFPYQSWGCGNEKTDSEFSVMFGRYVEIDQVDITVRAQWNPPQTGANDHDINWTSATLEFSDGTEMPIKLEKVASPQTFKLPEKKVVSWVRLKDLPVSEETIPVDGRKKFSALTEFKVWGTESSYDEAEMPSGESIVNLAKKINDYWIKTGGNTGDDATNYNHGHSITSEFWAPSVFYTGNMEAYYLTGDENYTDYAARWGSNNIYNGSAWNTKADTGRTGRWFPDNHTSLQTYLDMFSITSDGGYDPDNEMIRNAVTIMEEMEDMSVSELKNSKGYWDRIDFFYMELPNWTKMYLLTGEEKWLDKLRELYDDRKAALYDEETGLFYRDTNYIYDPNATYNPDGDGSYQKISPNGKKILWSRGNGWAMAALARIMQDLPDNRTEDRQEYEAVFKKMAETLIRVQGEDGFWRMNLDDYDHDIRPETSGTVFFAYGLAWGINHGILEKETYYPAVRKAFLGLNANAIRPDGLVGRSELISAYPNPKCSLGIGSSQSYAPAAAVLFLSELSKLENQGIVTDDVEPALNKRMIGNVAVKEGSEYAVVNSRVRELSAGSGLTTVSQDGKVYVPAAFLADVYGEDTAGQADDSITYEGHKYIALSEAVTEGSNRILSSLDNGISIISYKEELFDPALEGKMIDLLQTGLTEGAYPERPEYESRFEYIEPLKPSETALVSIEANSSGGVSAKREIGPNTTDPVELEFDMVTQLSPTQTNAIVGLGSTSSNYTAYSQVPVIIRMYNNGTFGAYNGTGYVQSTVKFTQNENYHIRMSVDLAARKYSAYVTGPDGNEVQIANDFSFRSTAAVPAEIGKIYLFNNDKEAGKYWLDNITMKGDKDKLLSITQPESLTGAKAAANGTALADLELPDTVEIETESGTVTEAEVDWHTDAPVYADGTSYDPENLDEQTFILKGDVSLPDSVDADGRDLTVQIEITVLGAGTVAAPAADPEAGSDYTEALEIMLGSATEGAVICYTTDGTEPVYDAAAGEAEGTGRIFDGTPIAVQGDEKGHKPVTVTIKAIAVKAGMKDSETSAFEYTVTIPHSFSQEWESDAEHHWQVCSCGTEGNTADHTWTETADEKYLVSEATCHAPAVYYKSCSVCGRAGTDTFEYGSPDPDRHDGETEIRDAKEPTETEEGYTGDTYCLGCGEKVAEGEAIPKLPETETPDPDDDPDKEEQPSDQPSGEKPSGDKPTGDQTTDGQSHGSQTGDANQSGTVPKTGDAASFAWLLVAVAGGIVLFSAARRRRES